MRKIWFIFCMSIVCMFGVTACVSAEKQAEINTSLEKISTLSDDLEKAYKSYKDGTLKASEFKDLTTAIKTTIENTKDEVKKLKEDGVGWGSLIGATLIGIISRGSPSKGPLAALFSKFSARPSEKKKLNE